jgi:hypothetical protein
MPADIGENPPGVNPDNSILSTPTDIIGSVLEILAVRLPIFDADEADALLDRVVRRVVAKLPLSALGRDCLAAELRHELTPEIRDAMVPDVERIAEEIHEVIIGVGP